MTDTTPLNELLQDTPAPAEPALAPEPEAQADAQPEPETPAEDDAPAAAEDATGEQKAPPPGADGKDAASVPIAALLDEREKRKALEARLRNIEAAQQRGREAPQMPDPVTDPDGYSRFVRGMHQQQQAAAQQAAREAMFTMSEVYARDKHGDDVVSAAEEAFQAAVAENPALGHELGRQKHPYDWVVQWHKQQQFAQAVGSDPTAYKERIRQELMAEMGLKPGAKPKAPRAPSLADETSVTGPKPGQAPAMTPLRDLLPS